MLKKIVIKSIATVYIATGVAIYYNRAYSTNDAVELTFCIVSIVLGYYLVTFTVGEILEIIKNKS